MHAASAQSGGIKRPIDAKSDMGAGVGDVESDVLVIDQQPTVGGRRVSVKDLVRDSAAVHCPVSVDVCGEEYEEEQVEDSGNEMTREHRVYDSKTTPLRSPVKRYWQVARPKWRR